MITDPNWWHHLYWVHAFDRKDSAGIRQVVQVIDVLLNGPAPNPNPSTKTAECERIFNVAPSVYFGLSRTHEEFGPIIVSFRMNSFNGCATPYDSGSLHRRLRPTKDWTDDAKKAYFEASRVSLQHIGEALEIYPSRDVDLLKRYLAGEWPNHRGPHGLWPHLPEADIWFDQEPDTDSRASGWEARCPERVPLNAIHSWSTDQDTYQQLEDYAATVTDPDLLPRLLAILDKCLKTPASHYLRDIVTEQEKNICG